MLNSEQIKEIAKYLNYSFSHRDYLTHILNSRSTEYGEDWDTEVSELLNEITSAKSNYQAVLSTGGIKRQQISGAYEIEYTESNNNLQGLKTIYYNLLGELFKLIELTPCPTSNYRMR